MRIFFDVDYTILGLDDTLRHGTKETFQKILDDGHEIHIWSGMGERWEVIEKHELKEYISGVYEKPTDKFDERFVELKVPVAPDFVIDDYPEIVAHYGGVWVPPYFFSRSVDNQLERIYNVIKEFAETGTSEDKQYRSKGTILPLF